MDTTLHDLSPNAQSVLYHLDRDYHRIALSDLEKSRIDWSAYIREDRVALLEKKTLKDHQKEALDAVRKGLAVADRGKMIMACGTGKTFTGLKIAENLAGKGKIVLIMVPSLALMSQTVREWKNDCADDFLAYSVCSDVKVGKRQSNGDTITFTVHDLAFPATTDSGKIANQVANCDREKMVVVFSTYQSIGAISDAQKIHGLPDFDLIICDEAHRTTGATLAGEDESNFVRIHSNDHVMGKKRLYMTATPKVYGENAKTKAKLNEVALADMNDTAMFGEVLFYRGFSWAVDKLLLSDYKVIVLAVDEGLVSAGVQRRLSQDNEMSLDDATKIIGCYKALTKQGLIGETSTEPKPMKRALAFCKNIAVSKMVAEEFTQVTEEFVATEEEDEDARPALDVQTRHVDGSFNAKEREDCLDWLKADTDADTCRILANCRCLSEGVDVPALDAIMFMHPRNSQIDVIQSVGRVMRRAEGKDMGYVILPVAVPAGMAPEDALNDNERYRVVWQILNALRAHDDRFDAMINQADLGEDISSKIEIIGITSQEMQATTAVIDDIKLNKSKAAARSDIGQGRGDDGEDLIEGPEAPQQLGFVFDELTRAIRAKIVEKCGTKEYWDTWAKDIAKIAQAHITRITTITAKEGSAERAAFLAFLAEIRDDLNPEISESDAVEMLAQHLITKPVFDTLFKDNEFTKNNPVSRAMETVLGQLQQHNLGKEAAVLEEFYASVQRRATGIKTAQGRQTLVVELYDKFFRTAFPTLTQKLGIVYTPVEVVDFIIHSVNDVLQSEFGQTLGSKGVHILDPFTGTGTFITRLLQSGLIKPEELEHKYKNEIHANEIVLLAYYIAAINIESVYHDLAGEMATYTPFEGILLTDTFQLYEQERDMIATLLPDNSERRTKQRTLDIRVIVGNPPYSIGQRSADDNAANIEYPNLDAKIRDTFAANTTSTLGRNLFDSYIRAIRWATDRIDSDGIVAFVCGSAWIERSFAQGLRRTLREEYSSLYVFHLRGDIRKNILSKGLAREGENIFGSGSMTGIAISVLVKNSEKKGAGRIFFRDIGDEISTSGKLSILSKTKSLNTAFLDGSAKEIIPDEHHDWLDQRDRKFESFPKMKGDLFPISGPGVSTNRDAWCHNASKDALLRGISTTLEFYQEESERIASLKPVPADPTKALSSDPKKISWSRGLRSLAANGVPISFNTEAARKSLYRPFYIQWLYLDRRLNEALGQTPSFFASGEKSDLVIVLSGVGARAGFASLMTNCVPNLHTIDSDQCFPLKVYKLQSAEDGLFATGETGYTVRDGISDAGLKHFKDAYPGEEITKEDLFYYIYGLLHSPHYRERFKNNLSKELPRIPAVKTAADFWAFSKAGRALGDLHVNYETVEPYPVVIAEGDLRLANIDNPEAFYFVVKMKFGGKGKAKDKTVVHYNGHITMTQIPLRAYDYVVNGKPALDWVMERQCVKTDKASGIVNDANRYAVETVGNPAYPLELFQRVITVSLETLDIVEALPKLDID